MARSAREIQEQGKELHRRLAAFAVHLDGVGRGLNAALGCYNSAVGSFESRLIPGARRFAEMNAIGDDTVAKLSVAEVTTELRALRRTDAVSGLDERDLPTPW